MHGYILEELVLIDKYILLWEHSSRTHTVNFSQCFLKVAFIAKGLVFNIPTLARIRKVTLIPNETILEYKKIHFIAHWSQDYYNN